MCVFLYGAQRRAQHRRAVRRRELREVFRRRQGIAWNAATELAPLAPTTPLPAGLQLSLPTPLAPLTTLFAQQKCAIVANVGPLIQPTTRAQFSNGRLPAAAEALFAQ